ncbi:MAG: leucine-rich repeat domain-containing protein, partial [Winogradskyella sp.]|nr:leucine-rich repeat domain-containing protein [Winogradskyella sp.]
MKKIIAFFVVFLMAIFCFKAFAQNTYVPDDVFETYCQSRGWDTGPLDDLVPTANISGVTVLQINNLGFSDLTGIEDFNALVDLRVGGNLLTSLDVSQNLNLESLSCEANQLTSLILGNLPALETVQCENNNLTSLNVSQLPSLVNLYARFNDITSINVTQNPLLQVFYFSGNQLNNLDLSQNPALTILLANNNNLGSLNVKNGNNTNIGIFQTQGNPNLSCIDVDDVAYSNANWFSIDAQTNFGLNCSLLTYVPDDNFEQALIDVNRDIGPLDDYVPTDNISGLTYLNIGNKNISDLTGLEDFTSLTELFCNNNQLTSLDVSQNVALERLQCNYNGITSLDVSQNTALYDLSCAYNAIATLDLSQNTALQYFNGQSNQLTSLNSKNGNNTNISSFAANINPSLTCIEVDDAVYSTINWTTVDSQTIFSEDCNNIPTTLIPDSNFEQALLDAGIDTDGALNGQVFTIDVSLVPSLTVTNKNISDLTGIEDFQSLTSLQCSSNNLTSLNLNNNTALEFLNCQYNNLTSLNLENNTALEQLYCDNNNLNSLNVKNGNNANIVTFDATGNPNLICIEVDDAAYSTTNWTNIDTQTSFSEDCSAAPVTLIPDANFEQALIDLGIDSDGVVNGEVLTSDVSSQTTLNVYNKSINDLTGIEDFLSLTTLNCANNQLTALDVSQNNALEYLTCSSNPINSLDVTQNPNLETLNCNYNGLISLDLSQNSVLNYLQCIGNELTSLDISLNPLLYFFDCSHNQLTTLDISQNNVLEILGCSHNQLTTLDVSQKPLLVSLFSPYNQLISLNAKNGNNINFTQFNAQYNPNLTCIDVDDVAFSNANWTSIDAQTSFSEDCSAPPVTLIPDSNFEQALLDLGIDSDGTLN